MVPDSFSLDAADEKPAKLAWWAVLIVVIVGLLLLIFLGLMAYKYLYKKSPPPPPPECEFLLYCAATSQLAPSLLGSCSGPVLQRAMPDAGKCLPLARNSCIVRAA